MDMITAGASDFDACCTRLYMADPIQPPLYSRLNMEYAREYARSSAFEDASLVLMEHEMPVAGVRMAVGGGDGAVELTACGRPTLYVEDQHESYGTLRRARKLVREQLDRLIADREVRTIHHRDHLSELSAFGRYLLTRGAHAEPYLTQVVDLRVSDQELHRQLHHSVKAEVNWGLKHLELRTLGPGEITPRDMDAFRELHLRVAGRETRSRRSWDLHHEVVRAGEGFMVDGSYGGELVTAALFLHTPRHCYYGVSASDREYFDKPISHAVIWTAMLHARSLGCERFETGEQLFPRQGAGQRGSKELHISDFKHGFGGRTVVRLDVLWRRGDDATVVGASHG
jgi:hypothetical protein